MQENETYSNKVCSDDPLVSFMYILLRDYLPAGEVESIFKEHIFPGVKSEFSNSYLANYAIELASRLASKEEDKMKVIHNLHRIDTKVGEIGVTVRDGSKWYNIVAPGDKIELCECTEDREVHSIVGHGEVIQLYMGKFSNVPAKYIEFEHEKTSRIYSGLLKSMRKAYGEDWFEDSLVTVLFYKRID